MLTKSDGDAARLLARVEIGGRTVPAQPLETVRKMVATGRTMRLMRRPFGRTAQRPCLVDRCSRALGRVPSFVRGHGQRIYADYARERGIAEITPAVMDTARAELGLEGM